MMKRIAMAAWVGLLAAGFTPAQETGDDDLVRRVDLKLASLRPTAAERKFDEIGWAKDIRTALSLAREHGRAVFLFTHDGRMATGRC